MRILMHMERNTELNSKNYHTIKPKVHVDVVRFFLVFFLAASLFTLSVRDKQMC